MRVSGFLSANFVDFVAYIYITANNHTVQTVFKYKAKARVRNPPFLLSKNVSWTTLTGNYYRRLPYRTVRVSYSIACNGINGWCTRSTDFSDRKREKKI